MAIRQDEVSEAEEHHHSEEEVEQQTNRFRPHV